MNGYTQEAVLKASTEYFGGDVLAAEVWANKYALTDRDGNIQERTPEAMHHRLAKEFARIESNYSNGLNEEEIFNLLDKFKYIVPQGSPMFGIGNDYQIASLSNCFVASNTDDSYGSIMKIDEELVQLMKRRGGVGTDLSHLRPAQASVSNSAKTSTGVVPFMERYSNSTREVGQQNRRGALLESISIKHPDAEAFIDAKLTEGKVTGANISVKLTDEFMKAVINDKSFMQQFPINSDDPSMTKEINAKALWNKIMVNAHKSAEPGIFFWDNVLKESIPSCYGEDWVEKSTNPCFAGHQKLLTFAGYKTFKELSKKDNITLINKNGIESIGKVWSTGIKSVIKLTNSINEEFTCTPNHVWMTTLGKEVEAKDMKGKRIMPYLSIPLHEDLYVKLGFIQGDGNLTRLKSKVHKGLEINIGNNDEDVLNFFKYTRKNNQRAFYVTEFTKVLTDLKFDAKILPERKLPKTIGTWSDTNKLAFLKGLYSANGSVISNYRVAFKSTSIELINGLTKLLKEFNINSYFTTNKTKDIKFNNGTYSVKESYDLNIGKFADLVKFYNKIGFIHNYKVKKLKQTILAKSPLIRRIDSIDSIEVFDFNEPTTNWGIVDGYIAHNCGELPLPGYDSCRLLLLNLFSYVKKPFSTKSTFDFKLFIKHAQIAQRLMDDLVDLEIEKIKLIIDKIDADPEEDETKRTEIQLWFKIIKKAVEGRRTGLGITGEGDMLAALGLTYGTDKANYFAAKVHKTLKLEAYRSSVTLAKERGSFDMYDAELEKFNPFIARIKNEDPQLYEAMEKYGRRNIALLTIAPAGSVSILTQTTSGIEPAFMISYMRRRKLNHSEGNIKEDFTDSMGDRWLEYPVFHKKFELWLEVNGYNLDEVQRMSTGEIKELIIKSPYHNATSTNVDWVKKVEMQGKVQRHIDHSISCTTNVPADTSVETVSDIYMAAYKHGLKGHTIYREGSRDGVLISEEEKQKKKTEKVFSEHHAPKRPKRLKADIVRFQNNHEKWIAVVGIYDDKPYEIFTGLSTNGLAELPVSVTECEVVKVKDVNGDKHYNIEYVDKDGEVQIYENLSQVFNPIYHTTAKLISGILRHAMPIKYVVDLVQSLSLDDTHLNTWKNGVVRVLKRYVEDGEKGQGTCPVCGSTDLEYKEGCLTCASCGNSKCN